MPLRFVLVVPFLLQISVAVGLTGWLSFRNGTIAVNDLATRLRLEVTKRISTHLDDYLAIPHQLNQINLDAIELGLLDLSNLQTTGQYFWKQLKVFDVSYISFANERGEYIGAYRRDDGQLRIDVKDKSTSGKLYSYATNSQGNRTQVMEVIKISEPQVHLWYRAGVKAGKPVWSQIHQWAKPQERIFSISAVSPVYDDTKTLRGVLGTDYILSQVSEYLSHLKISKSGKTFILERNGLLVASSSTKPLFRVVDGKVKRLKASDSSDVQIRSTTQYLTKHFGNLNQIKGSQQLNFTSEGQRFFVQVTPWSDKFGLDWLIVVVIPEADFMEQINANTRTTIWLCLGALGLATALGIFTAQWLTKPISRLCAATHAIANGNFNKNLEVQVASIDEFSVLAESFNQMTKQLRSSFSALEKTNLELEMRVEERTAALRAEQEKSEQLLLNILPEPIAEQLKQAPGAIAEQFDEVTILFADLVGFTPLSARLPPIKLVNLLNEIFSTFDQLASQHGLEKIKTIGDAYMVVGGLPVPRVDHAEAVAEMALHMQREITRFGTDKGESFQIRIGINTGSVVAGVIGATKFTYDLWGDTVNVASRMESTGVAGGIQCTAATYERLKNKYLFEKRGPMLIKGKGEMTTYWLISSKS